MIDVSDAPDSHVRRPRLRTKVVAVAALLAITGYAVTRPANHVQFAAAGPPRPLPTAELTPLSEAEFEGVLVGLRGRPVIVNIWASWCAPCRTETPLLERTWIASGGDITIIGVDSKDSPADAIKFLREFDVTYPTVFDIEGTIRARLGLRGFPTTYVFDSAGTLRSTVVGGLTEQRLAAILADLNQ